MIGTVLESELRIASAVSEDIRTGTARGAHVFLDITGLPEDGEAELAFHVDAKDPASGNYFEDIVGVIKLTAEELEAEPQTIFVDTLNPAPSVWRVRVETGDGDEWTYSVGASPIR